MKKITCPACGMECDENTVTCPYCGYDLSENK
ncbi:MAG: zinc-ribbon domain-containing protein [Bacteroidales bacterium]|nr:zinc-ribbon domain-containing protein [Bacteroidales bacterium]